MTVREYVLEQLAEGPLPGSAIGDLVQARFHLVGWSGMAEALHVLDDLLGEGKATETRIQEQWMFSLVKAAP